MTINNLYFYIIDYARQSKLRDICEEKKLGGEYCYYIFPKPSDELKPATKSKWILLNARQGFNYATEVTFCLVKETVNNNFNNIYLGIHATDWGVSLPVDEFEKIIPDNFSGDLEITYANQIEKSIVFKKDLKAKFNLTHCLMKLFSHQAGTIISMFGSENGQFFTDEGQQKIFQFDPGGSEEGASAKELSGPFASNRKPEMCILEELESLFFYFQVNLWALKALSTNDPTSELITPILKKLKFLLEGRELEREIQEVLKSTDQPSLGDKHFVDGGKVLGIGHYLVVFRQDLKVLEDSLAAIKPMITSGAPAEMAALESLLKMLWKLKDQISLTLKSKRDELG